MSEQIGFSCYGPGQVDISVMEHKKKNIGSRVSQLLGEAFHSFYESDALQKDKTIRGVSNKNISVYKEKLSQFQLDYILFHNQEPQAQRIVVKLSNNTDCSFCKKFLKIKLGKNWVIRKFLLMLKVTLLGIV